MKTDLLRGFVSMRTRRKFSAFLVMAPDGKTSFEFEPRKDGAPPKKTFFRRPDLMTKNGHTEKNGNGAVPEKPKRKTSKKAKIEN